MQTWAVGNPPFIRKKILDLTFYVLSVHYFSSLLAPHVLTFFDSGIAARNTPLVSGKVLEEKIHAARPTTEWAPSGNV
jgi:hypothetical protein